MTTYYGQPTFEVDPTTGLPLDANTTGATADGTEVSGTLGATGTLFTTDMVGFESITVQVTSAGTSCTITYETSDDNSTWVSTSGIAATNTGATAAAVTSTTANIFQFPRRGRYFRARVTTYGSGTVTVVGTLSKAGLTIPPAIFTSAASGTYTVVGIAAHDAAASGSPVQCAGFGTVVGNTAVAAVAAGDVARFATDLYGNQLVGLGLRKVASLTGLKVTNAAGSGDTTLVAAVSGQTTRVHRLRLSAAGATIVTIKRGSTSLEVFNLAGNGDGVILPLSEEPYYITAANETFVLNSSAAVQVDGYLEYITSA